MKPCDICLEKECKAKGGIGTCNCETCSMKIECPRKLRATIRITKKCTQSCEHCCFDCSPKETKQMSVEMAKNISVFLKKNEIYSVNLMGGEIFCNPHWREILDLIIPQVVYARIVSNGDWVESEPTFAEYFRKHKNSWVCISKDRWHNMKNVDKAIELLKENDIPLSVPDFEQDNFGLVPIGRSEFEMSLYSMFGCYCHDDKHKYSFLIDEDGVIYKCGFGVWDYDNIDDYLDGGFSERFKKFNRVFYDTWIPSCGSCIRGYRFRPSK